MNVLGQSQTLYHGLFELVFGDRALSVVNAVHPQQAACFVFAAMGKAGTTACDTHDVFHNGNDALFRWLLNNISLQEALSGVAGVRSFCVRQIHM